jgi:hypothetical protein
MTIMIECSSVETKATIDGTVIVKLAFDSDQYEGEQALEMAKSLHRIGYGALLKKVQRVNADIMRWNQFKDDLDPILKNTAEQVLRNAAVEMLIDDTTKTM